MNLRHAVFEDYMFVYNLRNSEDVRAVSLTNTVIDLDNHKVWFKDNYLWYQIITQDDKDIGFVRKDEDNEISICLVPEFRNKGIGSEVLKQLTGKAVILLDNKSSLKCFEKAGWVIRGYYLTKE